MHYRPYTSNSKDMSIVCQPLTSIQSQQARQTQMTTTYQSCHEEMLHILKCGCVLIQVPQATKIMHVLNNIKLKSQHNREELNLPVYYCQAYHMLVAHVRDQKRRPQYPQYACSWRHMCLSSGPHVLLVSVGTIGLRVHTAGC